MGGTVTSSWDSKWKGFQVESGSSWSLVLNEKSPCQRLPRKPLTKKKKKKQSPSGWIWLRGLSNGTHKGTPEENKHIEGTNISLQQDWNEHSSRLAFNWSSPVQFKIGIQLFLGQLNLQSWKVWNLINLEKQTQKPEPANLCFQ